METRVQRERNTQNMLDKIVKFNTSRRNEYHELASNIQVNYGIDHYVDLLSNLDNFGYTVRNNYKAISDLSDSELVTLERELRFTVQFLGLNISDIKTEPGFSAIQAHFPFSGMVYPRIEFWRFVSENARDPFRRFFSNAMGALAGDQEANRRATVLPQQAIQQLKSLTVEAVYQAASNLSREKAQEMLRELGYCTVIAMQIVTDWGPALSMAAFASGNIAVGLAISKVTLFFDLTLVIIEFHETRDLDKAISTITEKFVLKVIGVRAADTIANNIPKNLSNAEIRRKLEQSIRTLFESMNKITR